MKKLSLYGSLIAALSLNIASAHFQMLYTPESALPQGGTIPVKAVFTHPFADEHTMDMAAPQEFYAIHKGQKTDLKETLKPIEWTGNSNKAQAFTTDYKARGMGDHVLVLTPEPYLETNEDTYIQQITKMLVNVAGLPTDWDENLGLKAEIVPLTKPYAVWAGSTFTGVVMSEGKPVPFTEVEIEYLNSDIDVAKNQTGTLKYQAPQESFNTLIVKTDANGTFTFGMPKAGWWGFAAVGVGPDKTYQGKELSQDAVIWVQAKEMQ